MKIICYVSDDAVFEKIKSALQYIEVDYERIVSKALMLRALKRFDYDMILAEMDADLSSMEDPLSWLSRSVGDNAPVVLVSAIRSVRVIDVAIDAGATDFICLPFQPIECAARLSAILRRSAGKYARRSIALAEFALDQQACMLTDRGSAVELTRLEFALAWLFFSTPGVYISRERIGNSIWNTSSTIAARTIEQHVYQLRKKLRLCPERGVIIRTAYTQGYRLELLRHSPGRDLRICAEISHMDDRQAALPPVLQTDAAGILQLQACA